MSTTAAGKILIVDDEIDVLEFIEYNLRKEGYETATARDGLEAIRMAKQFRPDLVLLDVMMPNLDGLSAAEHLRSMKELDKVLVVFLTARSDEQSELAGFQAGADDYIAKPIKPRLLISRIKALLRRRRHEEEPAALEVGNMLIDRERRLVVIGSEKLSLPRKEFELLFMLASKPGRVFPRAEILKRIWGDDIIVGDRTIDVHVRKIRQKIGDALIKTVKGVGYKFEV